MLRSCRTVHGLHQADNPHMNQIVNLNMGRKVDRYPVNDSFHMRQIFLYQLIPRKLVILSFFCVCI